MASVFASEDLVATSPPTCPVPGSRRWLRVNAPDTVVVAGWPQDAAALLAALTERGASAGEERHALHSPMMGAKGSRRLRRAAAPGYAAPKAASAW